MDTSIPAGTRIVGTHEVTGQAARVSYLSNGAETGTILSVSIDIPSFTIGRNIKDCIALTSEAIILFNKKSFFGNFALKIDISKAFDTLN